MITSTSTTMRIPFPFYKRHSIKKPTHSIEARALTRAEQIATNIICLFETYGKEDYDGEPVSQTSHMVQCAMLAMENMSDLPVIVGALLHDIGHLLKHEQATESMNRFGVVNHEGIGAAYLRRNGFSERVCAMVEQHVSAKRYLVTTDKSYHRRLSEASLQTLRWQGGPMTTDEVAAFERHPYFNDIIMVRRWDEEAKKKNADLLPVAWFYRLIWDHLSLRVA
jgi:2-amino-1-hydroxyethylphosphonate dioxygenase (glycine-forming)